LRFRAGGIALTVDPRPRLLGDAAVEDVFGTLQRHGGQRSDAAQATVRLLYATPLDLAVTAGSPLNALEIRDAPCV